MFLIRCAGCRGLLSRKKNQVLLEAPKSSTLPSMKKEQRIHSRMPSRLYPTRDGPACISPPSNSVFSRPHSQLSQHSAPGNWPGSNHGAPKKAILMPVGELYAESMEQCLLRKTHETVLHGDWGRGFLQQHAPNRLQSRPTSTTQKRQVRTSPVTTRGQIKNTHARRLTNKKLIKVY